jgi:hypothetical protein
MRAEFANWYLILWRLIWIVPYVIVRYIFIFLTWSVWGMDDAKKMLTIHI